MHSRMQSAAFLVLILGLTAPVSGQVTLFTTEDYRRDREHWTDPAYYLYNTAREITDMQVDNRYGQRGSGADEHEIRSPYPYRTSWEHYQTWLATANGGVKHTLETLPNWDGDWGGGGSWLNSRGIQASTIAAVLTPRYREYYVQQLRAEAEGRHWWPASFCLPDGFIRGLGANQFAVRPDRVMLLGDRLVATTVRWIYTDGRSHLPEDFSFPQWQGQSIGFWDGDALVVHTNQIKGWNHGHSMFEWSDELTAVERYRRVGDRIEAEITLYDPVAFLEPLHARFAFNLRTDPDFRPVYSTCTDTNGPSSNVYINAEGFLDERVPGDSHYWDPTDPRPWGTAYAIGERAGADNSGGRPAFSR